MGEQPTESSGVQKLIDRLHDQGVTRGREEADALVSAARRQAMEIEDQAKRRAEAILAEARKEAERTQRSGEEAVRLAGRDTVLELTEALRENVFRKLRSLVQNQLQDESVLRAMVLEITRQAVSRERNEQVHLVFLDDTASDKFSAETLDEFARGLIADALREGLTYSVADSETPGIRVQFVNDDVEVELNSEILTELLTRRLSPRFRDILQTRSVVL
jgi:V/A-type H+/Na+-transporting ATPase subunit E